MRFPSAARAAFLAVLVVSALSLAVAPAFADGTSQSGGGQDPHPSAQTDGSLDGGGQDPHPSAFAGASSGDLVDLVRSFYAWLAGVAAL